MYTYSSSRHLYRPGVKICAVLWTKTFLKSLPTLGRPFTNTDIKFIASIICDKQQDQAAFLFHFLNISTVFQSSADAVLVQICFPPGRSNLDSKCLTTRIQTQYTVETLLLWVSQKAMSRTGDHLWSQQAISPTVTLCNYESCWDDTFP